MFNYISILTRPLFIGNVYFLNKNAILGSLMLIEIIFYVTV